MQANSKFTTIDAVERFDFEFFEDDRGRLTVLESKDLSFTRMFFVFGTEGCVRGEHAHISCNQFLFLIQGRIDVSVSDGYATKNYRLCNLAPSLLVPAGIWSTQVYVYQNSILSVSCDLRYDENDYIRSYQEFLNFKST